MSWIDRTWPPSPTGRPFFRITRKSSCDEGGMEGRRERNWTLPDTERLVRRSLVQDVVVAAVVANMVPSRLRECVSEGVREGGVGDAKRKQDVLRVKRPFRCSQHHQQSEDLCRGLERVVQCFGDRQVKLISSILCTHQTPREET